MTKKHKRISWAAAASLIALSVSAIGCGKQAFIVASTIQAQKAPGSFNIPPKVDILLAQDDSGSILPVQSSVQKQVQDFLTSLQNQNWDYHFAITPLTTSRTMNQVVASQFDSNWGSQWIPPYPGAMANAPGTIAANVFSMPSNYMGYQITGSNASNGNEPGLETLRLTMTQNAAGTNFSRNDSLLVMIILSNGQDSSKVNYCQRSDGYTAPCEQISDPSTGQPYPACTDISQADGQHACGSLQLSLNWYQSQFQGLRPNPNQVKVFSFVSQTNSSNCLGTKAWAGDRYAQMAAYTGGQTSNICNQTLSTILSQMASNLQATEVQMRTRYLFIGRAPDIASIKVTKYLNGSADQAIDVPQDSNNGWTYAGQISDYAIDYPIPMNLTSGYAIELHGSAKLLGNDTAKVDFKPQGWQNSAQ